MRAMTGNACAVLLILGSACVQADEVYLRDGRVLVGEVVSSPGAETVDLKSGSGTLVAIQHFDRSQVERITYGMSASDVALAALRTQRAALGQGGDAEDWWTLSRRARDLGDMIMAKECATETLARDRRHAEAGKFLGLVRCNGVWMRANEVAVAHGETFFRDHWVTWAEREAILADESRRHEEALAERQARDENRRIAAAQAAVAAGDSPPYPETNLGVQQSYPLYPPYGGISPYRSTYWQSAYAPVYGPYVGIHVGGGGKNGSWNISWGF
jgi:hypothetical protein